MGFKRQIAECLPYKKDGGRVTIRLVSESDTIKLHFVRKEENKEEYYTPLPLEEEEFNFNANTEKYAEMIFSEDTAKYGIYLDFDLIGEIHLFDYNPRNNCAELGYYFIPEYRGKGYAEEALNTLLELIFDKTPINKLFANTGSFNEKSCALLTKCGFSRDGILREHHELNGKLYDDYSFTMLRSDWENKK